MRLLITGASGQLGRCLQDRAGKAGFDTTAVTREELDISDKDAIDRVVSGCRPDVIINAAAYTAVDKAESDSELAYAVNEIGPKNLAASCARRDIPLIHISTDYVFDGFATEPYRVDSPTNPRSIYGKSKLAGELAVQRECEKYLIIRTSWVFSEYGNNFVKTMLRLAQKRDSLGVVADQLGCPTYAGDLASCILECIVQFGSGRENWGIYHFCGSEGVSWYDFSQYIFEVGLKEKLLKSAPRVKPITTSDYPTSAPRPGYSVLSGEKLERDWSCKLPDWHISLELVVSNLVKNI